MENIKQSGTIFCCFERAIFKFLANLNFSHLTEDIRVLLITIHFYDYINKGRLIHAVALHMAYMIYECVWL